MDTQSTRLVRSIRDPIQLADFVRRLMGWLITDMGGGPSGGASAFTESRVRALLRVTEVVDDPLLADFSRLITDATAARLAVYDLLHDSGLAESAEVAGFIAASAAGAAAANPPEPAALPWLSLAVAAFAWKREYPLSQLDPAAPPDAFSPAGSVLRETAQFLRQQTQRSPTERDRLARQLAFTRRVMEADAATLDTLPRLDTPVVPAPSVYRPPVPVRYPEVARETLSVEPPPEAPPPVRRGAPLVITDDDVQAAAPPPQRQPPLRVEPPPPPAPPSPLPASAVIMPNSPVTNRPSLSVQSRGRRTTSNRMKTTKLRVLVQQVAEGAGVYGVQVRVVCRRVRAEVAGTTNADGHFLCELPVKEMEGLTYQVEVTWPRDLGGDVERKAITLNADRTEFKLPFYRQYRA
ncbi:MAG: hypothetical protein Fur0021_36980 [Candidatus Promineifilaceae bacterium]